jgi:hypothetical protein
MHMNIIEQPIIKTITLSIHYQRVELIDLIAIMGKQHLLVSQIRAMKEQERTKAYLCSDYINDTTSFRPQDRQALCEWGYQTIARYNDINSDAAIVASSYFDRFMSTSCRSAKLALSDNYSAQLVYVTCLVIALKAYAGFNVELDFISGAFLQNAYAVDEIKEMEIKIIQALDWRLNKPTPHDFIDMFLAAIPFDDAHRDILSRFSKVLADLAVTKYSISLRLPSEVAYTAICCALKRLDAISVVDNSIVLDYLGLFSGFHFRDFSTKALFNTMECLMEGFTPEDPSYVSTMASPSSVSSVSSPDSIVRDA